MARLLLDTTVLIDFMRLRPVSVRIEKLAADGAEPPWTTPINVEELYRGLHAPEEEAAVRLVRGLRVGNIGVEEGIRAGNWRRSFADRGLTLTQSDCLVAAVAFSVGAVVATGNPKHFPMEEVDVEHWRVGE